VNSKKNPLSAGSCMRGRGHVVIFKSTWPGAAYTAVSCRGCGGVDVDTLAAELGRLASGSAACSALPSLPTSFSESCPLWGSGALGRAGSLNTFRSSMCCGQRQVVG
jgi:hypothetical protein